MRVLQLIDSLRPGGAEKMAVNIANALLPHVDASYLCCTRQEGMLKKQINPEVKYLFLDKRSSLNPQAILKLRKYIQQKKIDIVHAHSTSFFIAGLLKLSGSRFQLIWHDHYGESEFLEERKFKILKKFSSLFSGIISVNTALKNWAFQNLNCNNVIEIKNFIPNVENSGSETIKLKGDFADFKIVCVANIRPQKDHLTLIKAFESLDIAKKSTLHLIGDDPGTDYSKDLISYLKKSPSAKNIYYYGAQSKVDNLLKQAHLGVLSSKSEGLPLAILEYGLAGLPVVCTDVGKCKEVISGNGKLVNAADPNALANAILYYIINKNTAKITGNNLRNHITKEYGQENATNQIYQFYKWVAFQ